MNEDPLRRQKLNRIIMNWIDLVRIPVLLFASHEILGKILALAKVVSTSV